MKLVIAALIAIALSLAAAGQDVPINKQSYSISASQISAELYLDSFNIYQLNIVNKKASMISVAAIAEGNASSLIKIGQTSIKIQPGANGTIPITLLSASPGIYNGSLKLVGDVVETIPVNIKVADENGPTAKLLTISIEPLEKKITQGKQFKAIINVGNLLAGKQMNITLNYLVHRENSEEADALFSQKENFTINTSLSLLRIFESGQAPSGDYVFEVRVTYADSTHAAKARFEVSIPILEAKIFGLVPTKQALLALLACILLVAGFQYHKKSKLKKRRYQSKMYWDQMAKPGPRALQLGVIAETNKPAYFDIDQLQMHTLVAGSTGGGKTVSAQVFVEEALIKGASVVVFDPTAQWTGFLRKNAEKKMLALYQNFGLKPSAARAFSGNVRQIADKREVIDIRRFIRPGEITIFAINKLEPEDIDVIVANIVKQVFKAHLPESKELKLLLIFDEVHRLLPKFGGSGQGFLQIERAAREFRKWGVGLFLISQVLTDFAGTVKANISTEVQMRTRDQGDLDRIKTKYGDYMLQSLLKSATGTGMIENASYNKGEPYFVSFRPLFHNHAALSDDELANYNKYNSILDEIEFQIEQLKGEGLDIFDLTLEIKLSKDKLKVGNFNMVEIYLEGLRPRIADEWRKLGKTPKAYVTQVTSEEELQKEHELALKEKAKLQKNEPKEKAVEQPVKIEFKPLRLKNGLVVLSPAELEDALHNMPDAAFNFHLNETKNDFADWAAGPEPKLAEKLRAAKDKPSAIAALAEFQKAK